MTDLCMRRDHTLWDPGDLIHFLAIDLLSLIIPLLYFAEDKTDQRNPTNIDMNIFIPSHLLVDYLSCNQESRESSSFPSLHPHIP